MAEPETQELTGQECPVCHQPKLTLRETVHDLRSYGACSLLSMDCGACGYHRSDVEPASERKGARYTFEIASEEDLKVRVVKSAEASVRILHLAALEQGDLANGYITTVEGLLSRLRKQIAQARDESEDPSAKKRAKTQLKRLDRALWGQEKVKLVVEDATGASAILSDRAECKQL